MKLALNLRALTWSFRNGAFNQSLFLRIVGRNMSFSKVAVLGISGDLVDIFEVTPKIATLREGLLAHGASKGPLSCVLAEVISQIAALLEHTFTALVPAFKVKLNALAHQMLYLDCLVPISGNPRECFRFNLRHLRILVSELRLEA